MNFAIMVIFEVGSYFSDSRICLFVARRLDHALCLSARRKVGGAGREREEDSHSGLVRHLGKVVWGKLHQGFKSLILRNLKNTHMSVF